MSIQDKIAKKLLREHGSVLTIKTALSWHTDLKDYAREEETPEYKQCVIAFGKDQHTKLACHVADSEDLQIIGLQKHARLDDEEGMIFPYNEPRKANFHMGSVSFPIDIIFVGSDGRVTKKVENIEPATKGFWGMDHVSAVVEANGGFCAKNKIEVGTEVFELTEKTAQAAPLFNVGDIVVDEVGSRIKFKVVAVKSTPSGFIYACDSIEARPHQPSFRRNFKEDQLIQIERQAQEKFPNYPRKDINPKMVPGNPTHDRFRDRDLIDNQVQNEPMSQHHHEQLGNDPISIDPDDKNILPNRPG